MDHVVDLTRNSSSRSGIINLTGNTNSNANSGRRRGNRAGPSRPSPNRAGPSRPSRTPNRAGPSRPSRSPNRAGPSRPSRTPNRAGPSRSRSRSANSNYFDDPISFDRVHKRDGIELNKVWYDKQTLAQYYRANPHKPPEVPTSRRRLTTEEIRQVDPTLLSRGQSRQVPQAVRWSAAQRAAQFLAQAAQAAAALPPQMRPVYLRRHVGLNTYKVFKLQAVTMPAPRVIVYHLYRQREWRVYLSSTLSGMLTQTARKFDYGLQWNQWTPLVAANGQDRFTLLHPDAFRQALLHRLPAGTQLPAR